MTDVVQAAVRIRQRFRTTRPVLLTLQSGARNVVLGKIARQPVAHGLHVRLGGVANAVRVVQLGREGVLVNVERDVGGELRVLLNLLQRGLAVLCT